MEMHTISTSLRAAISDLAKDWVERPTGEHFDNGFCESEMNASVLREALCCDDEAALLQSISRFIADREQCQPGSRYALQVRNVLVALELPLLPTSMHPGTSEPPRAHCRKMLGR